MSVGRNDACPCGSGKKYKQCCMGQVLREPPETGSQVQQAAALIQAGRLPEAEAICLQILRQLPRQAEAHHLLGLVAQLRNQQARALELLDQALRLTGTPSAHMHFNRGITLLHLRRLEDALADFRRAVALLPAMAEAHSNMGQIYHHLGRFQDAVASSQEALRHQPDLLMARLTLARAWLRLEQLPEAADSYQRALALAPGNADILASLGLVLHRQDRLDEAETCYRQALAAHPGQAETLANLATLLLQRHDLDGAQAAFRQACTLRPDAALLHAKLGDVLLRQGHYAEAEAACARALRLDPTQAETRIGLGNALQAEGRLQAAAEAYGQALQINPRLLMANANLGNVLLAQGQPEAACAAYQAELANHPDNAPAFSNLLLAMQYLNDLSPDALFAMQRQFAARFEDPLKNTWRPHGNVRDSARRLRVGYVSGDFCTHAAAYFIEPVLAHHDRERLEVFAYYSNPREDSVTQRLRLLVDHWRPCAGMSDEALAGRIRDDGIDILVDLAGHTALNRLPAFARRPAPVQMTWLGYPGSTGLEAMDYRLTDASLDPPGQTEHWHSETLLRLPNCATFRVAAECPPVNPLPALSTGFITLGCLNNLAKINARVVRLWARLLDSLPRSRLMLGNVADDAARSRLLQQFAEAGIDADRLQLLPRLPLGEYLALHHSIDIALDPFPYGGGTTTNHALAMGVPVITLAGANTASRQGASLLAAAGLHEFITSNDEDYVKTVLQLAGDLRRLDHIRQTLRQRSGEASGIGALALTRSLEETYLKVWQEWCSENPA